VIVNESFARRYFKDRSPVGYRLAMGIGPNIKPNIEIIGVVKDFNRRNLRDVETEHVFFPYWDRSTDNGTFYVKMRGNPDAAFASIRALVRQVNPALPVGEPITFEEQIARSVWVERALATLSSSFGLIALLLSVVGLYGVMSLVVANRTQEIGVRMALGATRSTAVWLIAREVLIMIGAGTAIALPSAWAMRRLVQAQLFGISAIDAPTIAVASGFLLLVALGAAVLPAWRAASVSPIEALRAD
jgi:ABC-type antimicrobial peptide transport system permease subunit